MTRSSMIAIQVKLNLEGDRFGNMIELFYFLSTTSIIHLYIKVNLDVSILQFLGENSTDFTWSMFYKGCFDQILQVLQELLQEENRFKLYPPYYHRQRAIASHQRMNKVFLGQQYEDIYMIGQKDLRQLPKCKTCLKRSLLRWHALI